MKKRYQGNKLLLLKLFDFSQLASQHISPPLSVAQREYPLNRGWNACCACSKRLKGWPSSLSGSRKPNNLDPKQTVRGFRLW